MTHWQITRRPHLLVSQEVPKCSQVSLEAQGSGVSAAPAPQKRPWNQQQQFPTYIF